MHTRHTEPRSQSTCADPLPTIADPPGKSLEAARHRDLARCEAVASRFQRPVDWFSACHKHAADLVYGSLSMAGRMLTALVIALLVSLYVVNSPMETTYGLQPRPQLRVLSSPPALTRGETSGELRHGQQFEDDLPPQFEPYRYPLANDPLRSAPVLLAALFAGLAVLFTLTSSLGWVLCQTSRLGLRFLQQWAQRCGVEVTAPTL